MGCTLSVGEGTSVEFVNLAGVATVLFDVSEFVALVETVALSELTTEDITKVDAVAASELCEAGDRRYRWRTSFCHFTCSRRC